MVHVQEQTLYSLLYGKTVKPVYHQPTQHDKRDLVDLRFGRELRLLMHRHGCQRYGLWVRSLGPCRGQRVRMGSWGEDGGPASRAVKKAWNEIIRS